MNFIYAKSHQRAMLVADELDLEEWKYVRGPDQLRISSFHLIYNEPLTMGWEYRLSVARASGGTVTTQEYLT